MTVASVQAHSNAPLVLNDGVLKGLPKEFRPAGFNYEKKVLTLKGKELVMPAVLKKIFTKKVWEDSQKDDSKGSWPPSGLSFSASWYHGPSDLPPYLVISVAPVGASYRYEITIDMEKVEVMYAQIYIDEEETQTRFPIDLNEPKEEKSKDTKWADIIGKWRGEGMIVDFKENTIIFDEIWNEENKAWKVLDSKRLNIATVFRDDGTEDTFVYERNGDLLVAGTVRGHWGVLAKLGSKADLDAQRRNREMDLVKEDE